MYSAIMKCKIPSFVADFVHVEAWINVEDGTVLTPSNDSSAYGYFHSLHFISPSLYLALALSSVRCYVVLLHEKKSIIMLFIINSRRRLAIAFRHLISFLCLCFYLVFSFFIPFAHYPYYNEVLFSLCAFTEKKTHNSNHIETDFHGFVHLLLFPNPIPIYLIHIFFCSLFSFAFVKCIFLCTMRFSN